MKPLVGFLVLIAALVHAPLGWSGSYEPTDAERARWTMSDMRSIAIACEAYRIDNFSFPAAAWLEELERLVAPTYIRSLPRHDAWGTPLRYERMEDGKAMRIISAGSDGRFEPDTWSSPEALVGYSQDAVIEGSRTLTRMWQY